jgi:uncharacterized protein (TIGR02996 family)
VEKLDYLREILKAPKLEAPRLFYADYLQEQGDPRGELIQIQCEISSTEAMTLSLIPRDHKKHYHKDISLFESMPTLFIFKIP